MGLLAWAVLGMYLLWQVGVHAVISRLSFAKAHPHQKQAAIAIVVGQCLLYVTVGLLEWPNISLALALFILSCGLSLGYVYFHAFNMTETARRIRMLVNLKHGLPVAALDDPGKNSVLRRRFERLLALHQIERHGEKFTAKPTLLTFVAVILRRYERFIFPDRISGA